MLRKNLKTAISSFIMGILFATSTMVAFAAYVTSATKYYGPVYGYSYTNKAILSSGTHISAGTDVRTQQSVTVPTSFIGASANLYNTSGMLVKATSWHYNDSPSLGLQVWTDVNYTAPKGTYYSIGMSRAYNGNGYNDYYTNQSPNVEF